MTCRACGLNHSSLVRCEVALRLTGAINKDHAINSATKEVEAERHLGDEVREEKEERTQKLSANRRPRDKYNAYMREYMKNRRKRRGA